MTFCAFYRKLVLQQVTQQFYRIRSQYSRNNQQQPDLLQDMLKTYFFEVTGVIYYID